MNCAEQRRRGAKWGGGHWLTPALYPGGPGGDPQKPQYYVIPNDRVKADLRRAQPPVGSASGRTPSACGDTNGRGSLQPLREMGEEGGCSEHRQGAGLAPGSHAAPTPTEPALHGAYCPARSLPARTESLARHGAHWPRLSHCPARSSLPGRCSLGPPPPSPNLRLEASPVCSPPQHPLPTCLGLALEVEGQHILPGHLTLADHEEAAWSGPASRQHQLSRLDLGDSVPWNQG